MPSSRLPAEPVRFHLSTKLISLSRIPLLISTLSNADTTRTRIFESDTGGKGTPRRKMAPKPKGPGGEDPKLQSALKKLQVEPVSGIEEVNMFKEDGNVLHFAAPKGESRPM